ncbi:MAG TPA: hypothetical protein VGL14_20775, partial [Methylomirabilota bacterium]
PQARTVVDIERDRRRLVKDAIDEFTGLRSKRWRNASNVRDSSSSYGFPIDGVGHQTRERGVATIIQNLNRTWRYTIFKKIETEPGARHTADILTVNTMRR